MQELEKILEEIDQELQCYLEINLGDEYNAGIKDMAEMSKKIIRKHMNDGWILVEERMPEEPHEGVDEDDLEEYIVMIDGAERPATLKYAGNGQWLETGNWWEAVTYYSVVAWQPLPEPYRPERCGGE